MKIIGDVKEKGKDWLINVALKKAVVRVATLIVAFATANAITFKAVIGGISIDLSNVEVMTVALTAGLEVVRNYLKTKFPSKFSWL